MYISKLEIRVYQKPQSCLSAKVCADRAHACERCFYTWIGELREPENIGPQ